MIFKKHPGGGIEDDIDIFTYSFPCQDISNQGKQKGFEINSNTRSGLVWEIKRILEEIKVSNKKLPKYLLLENVKALLSKKYKPQYDMWIKTLNDLGYESKTYLLNSTNFNSPQNRERVFVLSIRNDFKEKVNFKFPNLEEIIIKNNKRKKIKEIVDLDDNKFNSSLNKFKLISKEITKNNIKKYELLNYTSFSSENYVYDINFSGPTLTASGAMSRIKLYFGKNKIRTINSLECFRYMGFNKNDYINVLKTKLISPSKMIYLCGNSIVVNVLEEIFRSLVF